MPTPWSNIASETSSQLQKSFSTKVDHNQLITSPIPNQNIPRKPKITVCIPYNGKWEAEWVMRSYIHICHAPTEWCTKYQLLSKVPSLPLSRDSLTNNALKTDCNYVFFLDTDIIFEQPQDPNAALYMLYQAINKDPNSKEGKIVSGLYRAKQRTGFAYAMWMDAPSGIKGFVPIEKWTGNWLKVDVCGMGCCLIDINVFKDIPKPYFHWELDGEMSEDFYFCKLAAKYGYDTHIFSDVKLSHLGDMKVKSDGTFSIPEM